MKPVIFMHVATLKNYQQIVNDVIDRLLVSNLINEILFIHFNVVGNGLLDFGKLPNQYRDKLIVSRYGNLRDFEVPTIKLIMDYVKNLRKNTPVLYLQTLSVSPWNYNIPGYWDRRDLFFYQTINKFKNCLEHLKIYDACGCNWNKDMSLFCDYQQHFSGNIWWANSEYLKTLPNYEWLIQKENYVIDLKHQPEFWIGMNPKIKHKSLYTWDFTDLEGGERLKKERYITDEINNI